MFFLGTHQPHWLADSDVPLFVSDRRLRGRRSLPRAQSAWALDSGGFTELSTFGTWTVTAREYAGRVARYVTEIGRPVFAAPQDWMVEPWIVAKTGLTVAEHQVRTVANFLELRERWAEASDERCPFVPVVQGWQPDDYVTHVGMYRAAGVDLAGFPVVGLGSVCRRQSTRDAEVVVRGLRDAGVARLHGFGFKVRGLARVGHLLSSADSMAWSFQARRSPPLPGCRHRSCANCPRYAYQWYERVVTACGPARQLELFAGATS